MIHAKNAIKTTFSGFFIDCHFFINYNNEKEGDIVWGYQLT